MRPADRPETPHDGTDRRSVAETAGKVRRRFRLRIRDWLVAVVLVALLAAGVAQLIRERRRQVERELAEAIRLQQESIKKAEGFLKLKREVEGAPIVESTSHREVPGCVFPDLSRRGLPDDGQTDHQDQ